MPGAEDLKNLQRKRYEQWKQCLRRRECSDLDQEKWESIRPRTLWELPPDDQVRREHPELEVLLDSMDYRPGDVLIATAGTAGPVVYSLRHDQELPEFQVHRETMSAWYDALAAVPRSLQYFVRLDSWSTLSSFPHVRPLYDRGQGGRRARSLIPVALDGPSFGLAFALSIASCLVEQPLPSDVVALAACDPFGKLLPVEGLAEKLEAIRAHAPRIRRVIVAEDQVLPEERATLLETCRPIRASRLQSAFAVVFPENELDRRLRDWVRGERPEELADQLLHYVLLERQRPNSLKPISDTVELVSEHASARGVELTEEQRDTLSFTRAVSLRRDGDEPMAASYLPRSMRWACSRPDWMRLLILAEYCQQTYDTGSPAITVVERLFDELTASIEVTLDPHHASFEELRLLSAWWRVAELHGRFRDAAATPRSSGKLPLRGSFGAGLHLLRHQRNDEVLAELARVYVRDALARWVPSARLVALWVTPSARHPTGSRCPGWPPPPKRQRARVVDHGENAEAIRRRAQAAAKYIPVVRRGKKRDQ